MKRLLAPSSTPRGSLARTVQGAGRFLTGLGCAALDRLQGAERARKAERLLHLTLTKLPIGLILWDRDLVVQRSSDTAQEILGASLPPGTTLKTMLTQVALTDELGHPVQPEKTIIAAALASGRLERREMLVRPHGDRRRLRISASAVPLYAEDGTLPAVAMIFEDITQFRRSEAARENLLRQLVTAQEDERRRLAGDLHDDAVQAIAAGLMQLDVLQSKMISAGATAEVRAVLDRVRSNFEYGLAATRTFMFNLRPPLLEKYGLEAAIGQQLAKVVQLAGCGTAIDWQAPQRLDPMLETLVFRTVQEALANVVKHAKASQVLVRGRRHAGTVEVEVEDDGIGFDQDEIDPAQLFGHIGMRSMVERVELAGGVMQVESTPGAGTMLRFRVPLEPVERRASARNR